MFGPPLPRGVVCVTLVRTVFESIAGKNNSTGNVYIFNDDPKSSG